MATEQLNVAAQDTPDLPCEGSGFCMLISFLPVGTPSGDYTLYIISHQTNAGSYIT